MYASSRPHRKFFSGAFAALLLASIVAAQDNPSGAPGPSDATALPILNLNPMARPTSEKTNVAQDSLFDFTLPRMMKPVGLIPPSDRGESPMSQAGAGSASGALLITLEEAQARAVSTHALILTAAGADAARYHRQAAQADYFPKVDATFVNIHYNKFMGKRIVQVAPFVGLAPTPPITGPILGSVIISNIPVPIEAAPLLNKDETIVATTVTQPVTPLFKVHQAVRIARADERIARAKANAASTQLTADVERAYFELLIAQRRQTEAEANVEIAERKLQIASAATTPPNGLDGMAGRETVLLEAKKALLAASDKVTELTNSFVDLTGFPDDARLELVPPAPAVIETTSSTQKPQPVIAYSPEIVEAEEAVVKARAAHRLAKLEYVPDVAIFGGYAFQRAVSALPDDFSFIGVFATFTLFDFGKREWTIKQRGAQVSMTKANLRLVRAKVAAGAQKTVMDLDRTRRILELTRQVVSMQRAVTPRDQAPVPEARAALAKAEAEMFQAELDYRAAYAQLKRVACEQ
jgi:outer membrane protein TolC